ncbi:MAG: cob(I)yrinic acid a,c-diamide adenosyltransferase [Spirochaetota bacterium]|jgi:cob(I)alamin adenosyltransferase|nr:cob(I)yrinic acid a,c-diamide adenosyltransferase [Spirochaetota bacterium]
MKQFEFNQVTTRGGDRGESSLADGERRRKDDLFFHTLGTIDELNSQIGVVRAHLEQESEALRNRFRRSGGDLVRIQKNLQVIGGMAAVPRWSRLFSTAAKIDPAEIEELEKQERALMKHTSVPQQFIQPGETVLSAFLHVARTVCRRSERWVVNCIRERGLDHLITAQQYLNRLADYLFIMALWYEQNREE